MAVPFGFSSSADIGTGWDARKNMHGQSSKKIGKSVLYCSADREIIAPITPERLFVQDGKPDGLR